MTGPARAKLASLLTHALAEELLLSSTTRNFSSSVPAFHSLHRLFADQYRQLERWVDQLAQRAWTLGGAGEKMRELAAARGATLAGHVPVQDMIGELLGRHEHLARRLREDGQKCSGQFGDRGTAEIFAHLVEFHETAAWMLRTILEGPRAAAS